MFIYQDDYLDNISTWITGHKIGLRVAHIKPQNFGSELHFGKNSGAGMSLSKFRIKGSIWDSKHHNQEWERERLGKNKEGQKLVCHDKVRHIAKPESGYILIEWSAKIKPVHKQIFLNCIIGTSP